MRHLILSVILLGWAASVAAQNTTTVELIPPPPPANDYFPEKWKEFRSEGRYSVLFPGIPKESTSTLASPGGDLLVHSVSYKSFIAYSVISTEYPGEIEKRSTIKTFMDQLRDGSLAAVAEAKPRVVKESDITLDGHPGRFVQVELANDSVVRMKWIAVKNSIYVVYITTPKGHQNVMGAENDYEKIAMSFMDSFRLLVRIET